MEMGAPAMGACLAEGRNSHVTDSKALLFLPPSPSANSLRPQPFVLDARGGGSSAAQHVPGRVSHYETPYHRPFTGMRSTTSSTVVHCHPSNTKPNALLAREMRTSRTFPDGLHLTPKIPGG